MKIKARAYAKINWALDILSTREDGYHELDMLMQSVSLHDTLTVEDSDDLTLLTDGRPDPCADQNLILRAARLLQEHTGCTRGARFELAKRTPAMAGLGGGSADCAAALLTLNELWELSLDRDALLRLGFRLGADVPFCLTGGLARVGGLGEQLHPLPAPPSPSMLLVMPDGGLSTGAVFAEYDSVPRSLPKVAVDQAMEQLLRGDYASLNRSAQNVLTGPALRIRPSVGQAIDFMNACGAALTRMSGSGSAVFAVFADEAAARQVEAAWQAASAGSSAFCQRIHTRPRGVEWERLS